ncbi:MAG TPA: bifunctional 5,10-methylenetetrahydrofolate dehydrogenase/5,10-methenyltetrahydrofolate cyclohydrolase [Candidatus Paceibacterota bacterium]
MALLLDGRRAAAVWQVSLKASLDMRPVRPALAIIQVGELLASDVFIRRKLKFGEAIGVPVIHRQFPEIITTSALLAEIDRLNRNPKINGIIVQLPLPSSINHAAVIEAILPSKDIDGLTAMNLKRVWECDPNAVLPATARGILRLLDHYGVEIAGRHAVVVGRSTLVGKPTALALLNREATITVCHCQTVDLGAITRTADIIVVAAGSPHLITPEYVSPGQTIVDVGITPVSRQGGGSVADGHLLGDVDFKQVEPIVAAISPVPGGVGPMTVAALFANLIDQTV